MDVLEKPQGLVVKRHAAQGAGMIAADVHLLRVKLQGFLQPVT